MAALADAADAETDIYFTGGATAVLLGWRDSTIDVDLKMIPERDAIFRAIPRLKEELRINVELASPGDFIPLPPGWQERRRFIERIHLVTYYHFDLYAQALAKLERSHTQDVADVREMVHRGLIDPARALELFDAVESELHRYPAVDPASFRAAVEDAFLP